jgi:hypothetical protein
MMTTAVRMICSGKNGEKADTVDKNFKTYFLSEQTSWNLIQRHFAHECSASLFHLGSFLYKSFQSGWPPAVTCDEQGQTQMKSYT